MPYRRRQKVHTKPTDLPSALLYSFIMSTYFDRHTEVLKSLSSSTFLCRISMDGVAQSKPQHLLFLAELVDSRILQWFRLEGTFGGHHFNLLPRDGSGWSGHCHLFNYSPEIMCFLINSGNFHSCSLCPLSLLAVHLWEASLLYEQPSDSQTVVTFPSSQAEQGLLLHIKIRYCYVQYPT